MRNVRIERTMAVERSSVWAVLADYPNIADWNGGVKTSYATGEQTEGVGATRHCDLAPTGGLEETIREWQPEEKLVVSIDSTARLPIRTGLATFELSAGDASSTRIALTYDYESKWGVIGTLMGGMVQKQLTKGFEGFLGDLDAAATANG